MFTQEFEKQAKDKDVKWYHRAATPAGLIAGGAAGFKVGDPLSSKAFKGIKNKKARAILGAAGTAAAMTTGGLAGSLLGAATVPKGIKKKMMKGIHKDPLVRDPKVKAELKKKYG